MSRLALVSSLALCLAATPAAAQQPQPSTPPPNGPSMVLMRTCQVVPGRGEEAVKWAKDIVALVNRDAKEPTLRARAFWEVFGNVGQLYWIAPFASMDDLSHTMLSEPTDPDMKEMLKQAPTLLRDCHDTILSELATTSASR